MTERLTDAQLDAAIDLYENGYSPKWITGREIRIAFAELRELREQLGLLRESYDKEFGKNLQLVEQNAKLVAAMADQAMHCECDCEACCRLVDALASVKGGEA